MKTSTLIAVIIAAVLTLASVCRGDESTPQPTSTSEFSQHVVWHDSQPEHTFFIPEARLQASARTSLPVHPDELEDIETRAEVALRQQKQGANEDYCRRSSHTGISPEPRADALSWVDLLRSQPFVAHGRVVETVAGLGNYASEVQTLIYVEIDEIWGCLGAEGTRTIPVGEVVSVVRRMGQIEVDGAILCNVTHEPLGIPRIGTEVVVSGIPYTSDRHYLGLGLLFSVVAGQIQPEPFPVLAERVPRSLEEIRRQMGPTLNVCEDLDNEDP